MIENTGSSVDNSAPPLAENEVLVFPLSFAQQRLWVLDRLEPNSTVYNVPIPLRLTGPLDIHALERSFSEVVRRHEVLRATFELNDGAPVQVIHPAALIGIPLRDLSSLPFDRREAEAKRLALEDAQTAFDLNRGPLFRVSLLRLADEDHVLLLTIHHIVFDGWSGRVLFRELMAAYNAFYSGAPLSLHELPLQYSDYAVWQHSYLSGERLAKQLDYWKQQLQGAPNALDLPTDFLRPARQSFRGAKCSVSLPGPMLQGLQQLSRREGVTLFMTLLSAFSVLLARYSGQHDIVVGSPVTGRSRVELENLIGFFVNTVVLRTDLSGNPTFRDILARVRETALSAYAHENLPFEKLVEELKPERDLSRNPIFQVMFAYQNTTESKETASALTARAFDSADRAISKFDLTLTATERSDHLRLAFEYSTDLFQPSTIDRLQQHFRNLLEAAVAQPDQPISDLPLMTADERSQILARWNQTACDYDQNLCVHTAIEQQAARTPDNVAVVFDGKQLSYRELNQRANQLSHLLQGRGIRPGALVGVCMDRSLEMLVSMLAVWKAGAAYLPLDPEYPSDRLAFMLEDSGTSLILTQERIRPGISPSWTDIICVDSEWAQIAKHKTDNPESGAHARDLAYVIYTSGSTGRPKGVAVEHRSLANFLASMRREPGIGAADVLLAVTTPSFDIAGLELFLPLTVGAKVVIATREQVFDGRQLLRLLDNCGATMMQATPATWRLLLQAGWPYDRKLKVLCGGEALPGDLAQELIPRSRELWNMYGPTETTIWSSIFRVTSAPAGTVPIGRPIANTQMYVLDSYRQPVPVGVPGELFIAGDGVARGYLNRPELNREKFISNPFDPAGISRLYRTGDLCRYLPDGNLQYLRRIDNQVKVRGYRIELGEIEHVLAQHPQVRQAVATVREDNPGDFRLIAYILPAENSGADIDKLRSHLKASLPEYMVPGVFVVLDKLPLTPNGKLDRHSLPAPEKTGKANALAPRDELEAALAQIWQRILGLEKVGVDENFFDLGGHSLLAVRLVTEIEKQTGQDIPLAALFQNATIEHLAQIVREGRRPVHEFVAVVQAEGTKPPFFGVVVPGGNPLGYLALSRHLGKDQPFYEIQGPGPRLRRPYTPKEFEELASEYIRAMKKVQPHGPYHFGGMCEGARIAFDMARLLDADGENVGLLAILDTWVLENSQNRFLWKLYYYSERVKSFWRSTPTQKWSAIRQWAANRYGSNFPERLWPRAYWPGKNFVPAKYSGKITVFKVRRQPFYYVHDPLLGWGTRTSGDVDVHLVESKHLALLREPYVRDLAPKLQECLAQARSEIESQDEQVAESHKGVLVMGTSATP